MSMTLPTKTTMTVSIPVFMFMTSVYGGNLQQICDEDRTVRAVLKRLLN
jgi:hypothetical protein